MKDDFANGVEHAGCKKCFDEERLGLKSLRQYANEWYGVSSADNNILDLELRFGNICNLKCIMCHPSASSSVSTERFMHRDKFSTVYMAIDTPMTFPQWWETTNFDQFLDLVLKHAKRINITGGEPFMIPEVSKLLDKIAGIQSTATVSFNTNLTKLTDQLFKKLRKINKINIAVSLEGVGNMNDYLRFPSQWQTICKNIKKIKQQMPQASLTVNHTFQHASVFSLPGLADYCVDNKLPLYMTMIQGMDHLTLASVKPDHKHNLLQWAKSSASLNDQNRNFVINACTISDFDPALNQKYLTYIQILDDIRGTDYSKTFATSLT